MTIIGTRGIARAQTNRRALRLTVDGVALCVTIEPGFWRVLGTLREAQAAPNVGPADANAITLAYRDRIGAQIALRMRPLRIGPISLTRLRGPRLHRGLELRFLHASGEPTEWLDVGLLTGIARAGQHASVRPLGLLVEEATDLGSGKWSITYAHWDAEVDLPSPPEVGTTLVHYHPASRMVRHTVYIAGRACQVLNYQDRSRDGQ